MHGGRPSMTHPHHHAIVTSSSIELGLPSLPGVQPPPTIIVGGRDAQCTASVAAYLHSLGGAHIRVLGASASEWSLCEVGVVALSLPTSGTRLHWRHDHLDSRGRGHPWSLAWFARYAPPHAQVVLLALAGGPDSPASTGSPHSLRSDDGVEQATLELVAGQLDATFTAVIQAPHLASGLSLPVSGLSSSASPGSVRLRASSRRRSSSASSGPPTAPPPTEGFAPHAASGSSPAEYAALLGLRGDDAVDELLTRGRLTHDLLLAGIVRGSALATLEAALARARQERPARWPPPPLLLPPPTPSPLARSIRTNVDAVVAGLAAAARSSVLSLTTAVTASPRAAPPGAPGVETVAVGCCLPRR